MSWSRRRVLAAAGVAAGWAATGAWARSPAATPAAADAERRLVFDHLHTGERLDVVFRRGPDYVPAALGAIQRLLRDFRNGEQHVIDPTLLDQLAQVADGLAVEPVFSVISGYRSPQTNEQLRERSNGVARHSLHLEGRAIDVRLAGVDCARLATHALTLGRGGVGYYRRSDFVHLDTGAVRTWKG